MPDVLDVLFGDAHNVDTPGGRVHVTLGLVLRLYSVERCYTEGVRNRDPEACAQALCDFARVVGVEGVVQTVESFLLVMGRIADLYAQVPVAFREPPGEGERFAYEFDGRGLFYIVHLIATAYGWSERDILDLPFLRALYYAQEIMLHTFHEHEWLYTLSPVAYRYDHNGKGRFVPLPRPAWMQRRPVEPPHVRNVQIPEHMLPAGVVVDLEDVIKMQSND